MFKVDLMLRQKDINPVGKITLEFSFHLLLTPRDFIDNLKTKWTEYPDICT